MCTEQLRTRVAMYSVVTLPLTKKIEALSSSCSHVLRTGECIHSPHRHSRVHMGESLVEGWDHHFHNEGEQLGCEKLIQGPVWVGHKGTIVG